MYKKSIIFLLGIVLVGIIGLVFYPGKKEILENTYGDVTDKREILSMMYEIKAESGEYQVSTDTTWPEEGYVFNTELSKCERGSKIYWNAEAGKVIMEGNSSDKCYVYFDKIPVIIDRCAGQNMATCMASNYELDESIYYHDENLPDGANDNSYRYSGANPNNYVCFGSNEDICPADNLYRIIGIFDGKVKLMKHSSYTNSYWGGDSTNTDNNWNNSTLNTQVLNGNFLNSLENQWQSKIVEVTWYVGGFGNGIRGEVASGLYDYEIRNSTTLYNARVGLIYVSEYGFAADPKFWNLPIINYNTEEVRNNNWIYENNIQWTISRQADSVSHAFFIDGSGLVFGDSVTVYNIVVKPTFYLDSNVSLISGTGTQNDPYRIN